MKKILIAISLFLTLVPFGASAQFGVKGSVLRPGGDIAPTHNNGPSYEIYYVIDEFRGHMQGRAGFFHAGLSPGLDTFHIYGVKSEIDGSHTLLPGFVAYQKLRMNCFFIDQSFRAVKVKNLELYAGIGIMVGLARMEYDRTIETVITETSGLVYDEIGGLRGNIHAAYKINGHFQAYVQAMHNAIVATDWSTSYSHNTFGLGINYFIKSRK